MTPTRNTLCKEERLHGRDAIDEIFKKAGSRSMVAFPLRVVYTLTEHAEHSRTRARMLVSVPKKHFKRAVKRNRVKRQVREAYRKNKHSLCSLMETMGNDKDISLAFIWIDDNLHSTDEVERKVKKLLTRIEEKIKFGGNHAAHTTPDEEEPSGKE